jgi:hypothetical protein
MISAKSFCVHSRAANSLLIICPGGDTLAAINLFFITLASAVSDSLQFCELKGIDLCFTLLARVPLPMVGIQAQRRGESLVAIGRLICITGDIGVVWVRD